VDCRCKSGRGVCKREKRRGFQTGMNDQRGKEMRKQEEMDEKEGSRWPKTDRGRGTTGRGGKWGGGRGNAMGNATAI